MTSGYDPSRRPARHIRTPINYQPTSRDAWESIDADSIDGKILRALDKAGIVGMMCWQVEQQTGLSHQSCSGNLRHLVERGWVVRSNRRGLTQTGRAAFYWIHRNKIEESDSND
jgi:hypothetical protein